MTPAIAEDLELHHGWRGVRVVRDTVRPMPPATEAPVPRRLVHTGPVAAGTDLETVAAAAGLLPVGVDLVGGPDRDRPALDPGAATVWPAVPPSEVGALLRGAGLALVPAPPGGTGTVPDTLYRAVAAGVPVVAADVGETATLVRGYRLGALYTPGDVASLVAAVAAVVTDYPIHLSRVRDARRWLSWACDELVLLDVYAALRPPAVVIELPAKEGTRLR